MTRPFVNAASIGRAVLFGLAVCAGMLSVPGCSSTKPTADQTINRYSEQLREAVTTSVPEEKPREQMLSIVDQLKAVHLKFSQDTSEFIAGYRKLNADYNATRPAFDQLFSDYNAKRVAARKAALDLHFQLATLATAPEWDVIGKAEQKMYEEVYAALPH